MAEVAHATALAEPIAGGWLVIVPVINTAWMIANADDVEPSARYYLEELTGVAGWEVVVVWFVAAER